MLKIDKYLFYLPFWATSLIYYGIKSLQYNCQKLDCAYIYNVVNKVANRLSLV